jgi:hypothetical protein
MSHHFEQEAKQLAWFMVFIFLVGWSAGALTVYIWVGAR